MTSRLLFEYITEVLKGYGSFNSSGTGSAVGNIWQNTTISSERNKGVLDDEKEEIEADIQNKNSLPRAACILVIAKNGKILAVSRKNDPTDFGLPGGKVDPGENELEAAKRELEEETGLIATQLTKVFVDQDSENYLVTTYAAKIKGEINTNESGVVKWVEPNVLLNGSFGEYNLKLLRKIGRIK